MKITEPSFDVFFHYPLVDSFGDGALLGPANFIEHAGRTCYKSENQITRDSSPKFVRMLMERGHESVIEHCVASVRLICDRGTTHELVRHRLASYSQESTRYCNYGKEKFGQVIGVIKPPFRGDMKESAEIIWREAMQEAEAAYFGLLSIGEPPEIARSVLPICLKTEIIMTTNLREWRHVFKLRCSKAAHPMIRELMLKVRDRFVEEVPEIFDDLS